MLAGSLIHGGDRARTKEFHSAGVEIVGTEKRLHCARGGMSIIESVHPLLTYW